MHEDVGTAGRLRKRIGVACGRYFQAQRLRVQSFGAQFLPELIQLFGIATMQDALNAAGKERPGDGQADTSRSAHD